MELILKEDFPKLGYVGDRVSVRSGYARNFLIPRGIALEASGANLRALKHKIDGINAKKAKLKVEAEQFGQKLQGLSLAFELKMGERGKSFGAITTRDVELEFKKHELVFDRKQIKHFDPIKTPGNYEVHIRLHSEVTIPVPIRISSNRPVVEPGAAADESKPKRGAKRSRPEKAEETEPSTSPDPEELN